MARKARQADRKNPPHQGDQQHQAPRRPGATQNRARYYAGATAIDRPRPRSEYSHHSNTKSYPGPHPARDGPQHIPGGLPQVDTQECGARRKIQERGDPFGAGCGVRANKPRRPQSQRQPAHAPAARPHQHQHARGHAQEPRASGKGEQNHQSHRDAARAIEPAAPARMAPSRHSQAQGQKPIQV